MNVFSKIKTPMQTLGIIGLLFFVMAFECGKENGGGGKDTDGGQTTSNGGSCSTKAEFLGLFKRDRLNVLTSRDDLRQSEIIVDSFNVGKPITYSPVYNGKVVEIYPAYPITINWTARTFRYDRVSESDYKNGLFYCYKNPEDYDKFPSEDDRFPKDACVCIAQNSEAVTPVPPERECPYDENNPQQTCSGN